MSFFEHSPSTTVVNIIFQNCTLEEVFVDKYSAVAGVKTNLGYIECESFINAAGFWARHIGTKSTPRVQVKPK